MSDPTGQAPESTPTQPTPVIATPSTGPYVQNPPAAPVQQQTFDAEYVQKLRDEAAKYRTEAKANADAAAELAKIKDAAKSNEQKQAERIAELEAQLADAGQQALRAQIAVKHHLTADDAALLVGNETQMEALAARLSAAATSAAELKRQPVAPELGRVVTTTTTGAETLTTLLQAALETD